MELIEDDSLFLTTKIIEKSEEYTKVVEKKILNNVERKFGTKNNCRGLSNNFQYILGENIQEFEYTSKET